MLSTLIKIQKGRVVMEHLAAAEEYADSLGQIRMSIIAAGLSSRIIVGLPGQFITFNIDPKLIVRAPLMLRYLLSRIGDKTLETNGHVGREHVKQYLHEWRGICAQQA